MVHDRYVGSSILDRVSSEAAGRITCGPPREEATEPCLSFISNVHQLMHYIATPIVLAAKLDETLELIFEWESEAVGLINYTDAIADDSRLSLDLMLIRTVDHFLTYISGLLTLVFEKYPKALSAIPVKLGEILQYSDRDEVVRASIHEHVRGLSYNGLQQLQEEISSKVGFRLFKDTQDSNFAIEAVEIRNVLVHNNGYVDSRLAKNISKYSEMKGKPVAGYSALRMVHFLTIAVQEIDIAAVVKWKLPAGQNQPPHFCHRLGPVPRPTKPSDY